MLLLALLLLLLPQEHACSMLSGVASKPATSLAPNNAESQLLHLAVADGDADLVRSLVADGTALEARDQSGFTPLTYAAFNGDFDIVMLLCAAGASASAVDNCGTTPIHWAVLHGHALCAYALLQADRHLARPGACMTSGGSTPLMLASAANDIETVEALLAAGVDVDEAGIFELTAWQLASAFGHDAVASLLREHGASERPITPPAASPPPAPVVITITAEALASDAGIASWHRAFAESVPLYVRGLCTEWSEPLSRLAPEDLSARWGEQEVAVCFSPDDHYQTHTRASPPPHDDETAAASFDAADATAAQDPTAAHDPVVWRLRETPSAPMRFADFIDSLPRHGALEYFAVQQSPSSSLDEFAGLPSIPPLLERLMRSRASADVTSSAPGASADSKAEARLRPPPSPPPPIPGLQSNLWVCRPPKRSQLHFDHQDSVLLQMQGTKRFTLVDPRPLDGLVTHPSRLPVARMARRDAGRYEYDWSEESVGRQYDNFPLANVTHPDLDVTPLMAFARTVTVEVHEGDALILPAYWYHQVESEAEPGRLNVAVNYWWSTGAAPATWHGALRERVRARSLTPSAAVGMDAARRRSR